MAECKECKVLREWNDELRDERDKLLALLNTEEEVTVSNLTPKHFEPINTLRSWSGTKRKLENKYKKAAQRLKDPVQVIEN